MTQSSGFLDLASLSLPITWQSGDLIEGCFSALKPLYRYSGQLKEIHSLDRWAKLTLTTGKLPVPLIALSISSRSWSASAS